MVESFETRARSAVQLVEVAFNSEANSEDHIHQVIQDALESTPDRSEIDRITDTFSHHHEIDRGETLRR